MRLCSKLCSDKQWAYLSVRDLSGKLKLPHTPSNQTLCMLSIPVGSVSASESLSYPLAAMLALNSANW